MNWIKWRYFYYVISGSILFLSAIGILLGGLKPALEFTGGSQLLINSEQANKLQQTTQTWISQSENETVELVSASTNTNQLTLDFRNLKAEQKDQLLVALTLADPQLEVQRFQNIGPAISTQLIQKTSYAVVLAVLCILLYVWWQFKNWKYGLAAVLAMLHDSFILLGSFAWLGYFFNLEIDLLFITALLTTLSFSVHDTIVVFDRLRELYRNNQHRQGLADLTNQAITQTLSRSVNNSLTIIFMLLALLLLGGVSIREFTLALLIGTITGTYSSTFTALPLYYDLQK